MSRSLVIAGMHRSGTSLLANALGRAGVDLGEQLVTASRGNRHGHFEDVEFLRFHERFLDCRGIGALTPPADWQPRATPAEEAAARDLVAVRAEHLLWGFKDPRGSLFLDFWHPLLPSPRFLLVYRHPVEVALSLLRRGIDLEVQLDPWTALRAWQVYNARLLAFHCAHPGSCRLWNVWAVADRLDSAVGSLAAWLGLPLRAEGLQSLFVPEDLRGGLWAAEIRWRALLPEALDLYAELETAADLPAGEVQEPAPRACRPSPREREMLAANEHLLAAALRSRAPAAAVEVSGPLRVLYSDLRRLAAEQEQEIDRLAEQVRSGVAVVERLTAGRVEVASTPAVEPSELEQLVARQEQEIEDLRTQVRSGAAAVRRLTLHLRTQEEEWARIEGSRAFRLVRGYWSAVTAARAWGRRLCRLASRAALSGPRTASAATPPKPDPAPSSGW